MRPVPQRSCLLLPLLLGLGGCITYPVLLPPTSPECQLLTREMSLETVQLRLHVTDCGGRVENCLAAALIGTLAFTTTTLVSGSVALVGNTVHWLERSQRCPPTPAEPLPATPP